MFRMLRWNKKVLLELFAIALLFTPFAATAVSRSLPDNTIDTPGSSNLFLEIARSGNGNSLQAPQTFAKFAFFANPSKVNIYDGAFCTGSSFDTNGSPTPTSCTGAPATDGQVTYTFYPLNADGSTPTVSTPGHTLNSVTVDAWNLAVNATTAVDVSKLKIGSADSTGAHFVYMKASFVNTNPNVGGVNAFKVSVNSGVGVATYDASDSGALDQPLAIQHRPLAAKTGSFDAITFQFGPGCSPPSTSAALKWQDADAGNPGVQPEDITWQFIDDGDGMGGAKSPTITLNSTNTVKDAKGFPVTMGGQGAKRTFYIIIKAGHHYTWRWTNVDTHNGVQVFLPFDGYNYTAVCNSKIIGSKVDQTNTQNSALTTIPVTLYKNNGSKFVPYSPAGVPNPQSTKNTFTYSPLVQGTYEVHIGTTLPAGVTYTGYTICINNTSCHTTQAKTNSTNATPINVISPTTKFSVLQGQYADIWFHFKVTKTAVPVVHKIYGANVISILQKYVRDNFTFPFKVGGYFWADAGQKTDGNNRLWLAGIWDDKGGAPDNTKNAEINNITTINTAAEAGCPASGGCLQRVPLAYVPQDDGTGKAATPNADGSTTPAGNNWLSIRNRAFGSYDPLKGGIASSDNSSIGGFAGNHLKSVEISNIHVGLANIDTSLNDPTSYGTPYQGKVNPTELQPSDTSLNLPTGSQGPSSSGIWDNVRNPVTNSGSYSAPSLLPGVDFPNGSFNFTADPTTIASGAGKSQDISSANGQATSLLQDGQGSGYQNQSEPLTLTGSVTSADASVKWDEYIDWSQVDDKGHWRPISSGGVATGFEYGAYTNPHNETLHYYSGGNTGSPVYQYTTYYYYCYNSTTGVYTYGSNTSGTPPSGCTNYYSYDTYNYSTACQSTGPTYAYNTYRSSGWSTPNNETQFGWVTSDAVQNQSIPKGSNGQTAQSYFNAPNGSSNPAWSNTGSNAYWQDTNITGMSNSGSSTKPAHSSRWVYNTSDPLYSNRMIYDGYNSVTYSNGYVVGGSTWFCYYNAPGSGGSPATDVSYSQYIDGYYANSRSLYENSSAPSTPYYGLWGNGATFDGNTNGTVDTGWTWVSNKQRVQYEQTYLNHTRKLGDRKMADPSAAIDCTDKTANNDEYFLGEAGAKCLLPGRDSGVIYNPTISISNADVMGTSGISGYFNGNNSSSFLFSNGFISGFSSVGNFPGYYNNSNKKANAFYDPTSAANAIKQVFGTFFSTEPATAIGNNISGGFGLNGRLYKPAAGDLTLGATTFSSGQGTIYVNGNLHITGNIGYAGSSSATDKSQLPSVGIVVTGNIIVDPNVTSIVGTYFAGGTFNTRSTLKSYGGLSDTDGSYNDDRASSDQAFRLDGVMIALNFNLQRQLGNFLGLGAAENTPESFVYDGRIVVNPPIGFSDIQKYPASWNESVPYN